MDAHAEVNVHAGTGGSRIVLPCSGKLKMEYNPVSTSLTPPLLELNHTNEHIAKVHCHFRFPCKVLVNTWKMKMNEPKSGSELITQIHKKATLLHKKLLGMKTITIKSHCFENETVIHHQRKWKQMQVLSPFFKSRSMF